jgi:hypothetical protein
VARPGFKNLKPRQLRNEHALSANPEGRGSARAHEFSVTIPWLPGSPGVRTPLLLACATFGALPSYGLYDPKPIPELAQSEGEWIGTLTYEDYQPPHRRMELPTRLQAALDAPNEISLHFSVEDGPGKVVQSYERIRIDLKGKVLIWSGLTPSDSETCRILSSTNAGGDFVIVAEIAGTGGSEAELTRYHFTFGANTFQIAKEEGPDPAALRFRNRYVFRRRER